jgi:hypothetical protein
MVVEVYDYIQFHIAVRAQNFPYCESCLHARRYMGGESLQKTLCIFCPEMNKIKSKHLGDNITQSNFI